MNKSGISLLWSILLLAIFAHGGLFLIDKLRFQAGDAELYGMGNTEIFSDLIGPEYLGECAQSKQIEFYYTGKSVTFRCSKLLESVIFWPYSSTVTTSDNVVLNRLEENFLYPYRDLKEG